VRSRSGEAIGALDIFTRFELVWSQAETLRILGRVYHALDERARADAAFDAAIEIYRRCGAGQPWIDRIEKARQTSPKGLSTPAEQHTENNGGSDACGPQKLSTRLEMG